MPLPLTSDLGFGCTASGSEHRIWRIRLRHFLLTIVNLELLLYPRARGRTLEQMDHVFEYSSSEEEEARCGALEEDILRQGRTCKGRYSTEA